MDVDEAPVADAQSLGTFRWQLQPYCNVVTINVTGVAGVYTLEGYDDQCGAPTRAPLTGVATPNPDGTIGFGFTIVTSPGGRGVQVEARLSLAGLVVSVYHYQLEWFPEQSTICSTTSTPMR